MVSLSPKALRFAGDAVRTLPENADGNDSIGAAGVSASPRGA